MTSSTSAPDSKPKVKNIANPRRLLILTPTSQSLTTIPPLLRSLTGVPVVDPPQETSKDTPTPQPTATTPPSTTPTTTFAGYTTHSPLRLSTKYYTAEVPVWVDEIPLSTERTETTATQWRTEFLGAEAEIVRDAVGALVVCVRAPEPSDPSDNTDPAERQDVRAVRELMGDVGAVKSVIDEERGGTGDVPGVLVLVGAKKNVSGASTSTSKEKDELELGDEELGEDAAPLSVGWWEDQMFDMGLFGWEVIEWDPAEAGGEVTRNKFGEYEGMPRIKEVLETHDWTASGDTLDADELDSDDDFGDFMSFDKSAHSRGFGEEVNELEREMFGLRMAIERGGDGREEEEEEDKNGEDKVESIEALMMRMQSIRDMSADMPESQRKRFAAKAVQDIMKDL